MVAFINEHRAEYGVEPICAQLPIAPSTYYRYKAQEADPSKVPARHHRDQALKLQIKRVWNENHQGYGARKVWLQLNREGVIVARCTVERLMRAMGLRGVVRGEKQITTISDPKQDRAPDLVKRIFKASRPTSSGWQISVTPPPGPALFMWPLSLMSLPAALLAGGFRRP